MNETDTYLEQWIIEIEEMGLWAPLDELHRALKAAPPIPLDTEGCAARECYIKLRKLLEFRRRNSDFGECVTIDITDGQPRISWHE